MKSNQAYQEELSEFRITIMNLEEETSQRYVKNENACSPELSKSPNPPPPFPEVESSKEIESEKHIHCLEEEVSSLKNINKRISEEKELLHMTNKEHIEALNENFYNKTQ